MMINTDEFRSHVLSLLCDEEFNEEIAQLQAKALLSELSGKIPLYNWTYLSQRVIRNVVMATFELESLSRKAPNKLDPELQIAARKLALIWESLAKLGESVSKETALLNAAVNYELAGYQANSMCLASRMLVNMQSELEYNPLAHMSTLFLQRRFLQLIQISKKVQVEPDDTSNVPVVENIAIALSGNAFSYIIRFFLSGDEQSFKQGIEALKGSEKIFTSLGLIEESNLLWGLLSLLLVIKARSTWFLLSDLIPDQPKWDRYLKLLARGVGTDIYGSRSISELWPSQISALNKGLLNSTSSKIIRMPTSAGKTRIAELAIVHTLIQGENAKCIYVAPYRALVSELEQSFFYVLNDLGYKVSSIIGSYESDDFEKSLFFDTDLLVTTPEKLDLLLRAQQDYLQNVRLFVLDESHIVNDTSRGVKFELLMTRLKKKLPHSRTLVLSAMMPEDTLRDFAYWFNASPREDIIISTWRPSIQRYAKFEWSGDNGFLLYPEDDDICLLNQLKPAIIQPTIYEYRNPSTARLNHTLFPEKANKSQIAAELAYKFAEMGPVLIFCSTPRNVEAVASALYKKLELLRLANRPISEHFIGPMITYSSITANEWLGGSPLEDWLKSGIGIHYGGLPEFIRTAVEKDFRQRKLRVLVATNTLAQGVNLPIKTVIIHSCRRYIDESHPSERIPARDYWNIAGRAGRAGEETEGFIIHIKINRHDGDDFQYYLSKKENVEPVEGALYQILRDLIQDRLSPDDLELKLDPEILALLVEEDPTSSLDEFTDILNDSLVCIQANRSKKYSIEPLNRTFKKIADRILQKVSSKEYRALFSSTGLCTNSCLSIHDHIRSNSNIIKKFLLNETEGNLNNIIDLIIPTCMSLDEMQSARQFGGNCTDLLKQWIRGSEMKNLIAEFGEQARSTGDLGRFIEDLFGYRLPWGISSYIQIAIKILDVNQDLISMTAKSFPAMVRYGLPDPIACWAMSIGIPYRRVAINLSAKFRDDIDEHNYDNFIRWLGTLSAEYLNHDLGLRSPLLEDVSRVIFTASSNPILRDLGNINDFLPIEIEVKGIRYNNRYIPALKAKPGQNVLLLRDYDNIVDRNAILVKIFNEEIGYVPRDVAQILAPEIDTGSIISARITKVNKDQEIPKIWIGIRLIS